MWHERALQHFSDARARWTRVQKKLFFLDLERRQACGRGFFPPARAAQCAPHKNSPVDFFAAGAARAGVSSGVWRDRVIFSCSAKLASL
ncbi:MAG: hypothetical protein C3F11_07925 [Methylocystaceae bacterium]|nr:MAG: hypothetical protein C3F11_07925 [Methylocystaceae bacterium]